MAKTKKVVPVPAYPLVVMRRKKGDNKQERIVLRAA